MDYTEQKKLAAAVNKIGANSNSSHLILLLPGVRSASPGCLIICSPLFSVKKRRD
ncbi:MAG: hypothetical protein ACLR77_13870 [Oscillospiraceae bacterium]